MKTWIVAFCAVGNGVDIHPTIDRVEAENEDQAVAIAFERYYDKADFPGQTIDFDPPGPYSLYWQDETMTEREELAVATVEAL